MAKRKRPRGKERKRNKPQPLVEVRELSHGEAAAILAKWLSDDNFSNIEFSDEFGETFGFVGGSEDDV